MYFESVWKLPLTVSLSVSLSFGQYSPQQPQSKRPHALGAVVCLYIVCSPLVTAAGTTDSLVAHNRLPTHLDHRAFSNITNEDAV